jgi:hypothetical protein
LLALRAGIETASSLSFEELTVAHDSIVRKAFNNHPLRQSTQALAR